MGYYYIGGTILFTVYGQLILKWRMNGMGVVPEPFAEKFLFLFKCIFDPYIFSGFVAAFVACFAGWQRSASLMLATLILLRVVRLL